MHCCTLLLPLSKRLTLNSALLDSQTPSSLAALPSFAMSRQRGPIPRTPKKRVNKFIANDCFGDDGCTSSPLPFSALLHDVEIDLSALVPQLDDSACVLLR